MVVLVTCLVVAVKYLTKATEGRKALFWLKVQPRIVKVMAAGT